MKKVTLKPLYHKNQECIGIYFENTTVLNGAIRKNAGAKWSQTNKCWYIPLSKENYNKLFFALKGKAAIEQSALHEYLAAKKKKVAPAKTSVTAKPVTPAMLLPTTSKKQVTVYKGGKIQAVNAHVIPAMEQHLKLKAYSPSTIKTYLGEMTQLLTILKTIPADESSCRE